MTTTSTEDIAFVSTPEIPVRNDLSGTVRGAVVQSGSIGHITINNPSSGFPVPSQLPRTPRAFTNRHRELSLLRQWSTTTDDGPLVALITGAGGSGKTALALRWLHDTREDYPDGQLYVDLDAFAPSGPATPDRVLEWFLLALGVPPETVPAGLAQREALYRSLTARRAVAVLLDNASSAGQVRPLLPASDRSVVVVTSRRQLPELSLDGARFLEASPFSPAQAAELLTSIVGPAAMLGDTSAMEELARLCGGLPLALCVVASRLAAHPPALDYPRDHEATAQHIGRTDLGGNVRGGHLRPVLL